MPDTPEDKTRRQIDRLLQAAGWQVSNREDANIDAAAIAVREFAAGGGAADYVLYLEGKTAGIVEAKRAGVPLSGAEIQAEKYAGGIPPLILRLTSVRSDKQSAAAIFCRRSISAASGFFSARRTAATRSI